MRNEIALNGLTNATQLLAFDDFLLVGESGSDAAYHLFKKSTGEELWTWDAGGSLAFTPAYSQGIVLVGSASTAVAALRIVDGAELWRDDQIGDISSRDPIKTGDLAIYHGADEVVAASAHSGQELWRLPLATEPRSLAAAGNRIYVVEGGHVRALNLLDGETLWEADADGDLVATEETLFVSGTDQTLALDAATGLAIWQASRPQLPIEAPLLTRNRLILAAGDLDEASFVALDPASGDATYEKSERVFFRPPIFVPFGTIQHLLGVGDAFAYLNFDHAIQLRQIRSGTLFWSIPADDLDVRALVSSGTELLVLLPDRVLVYGPSFERFVPHFADGQGQTTIVALANNTDRVIRGRLQFFDNEGNPPDIVVSGLNMDDPPGFEIGPRQSLHLSTQGGDSLRSGWIGFFADGPLDLSSINRAEAAGTIAEAGIEDGKPFAEATVPVQVEGPLNTAIAFANPMPLPVEVRLTLIGSNLDLSAMIELPAHGHLGRFVNELFGDEVGTSFQGTMRIESDLVITATAMRTFNGLQLSSLTLGQ